MAVGCGYCRLQMPLKLALAIRETVAGRWLGALEGADGGGAGKPPLPIVSCQTPPFQWIPGVPPPPPPHSPMQSWSGVCISICLTRFPCPTCNFTAVLPTTVRGGPPGLRGALG